MSESVNPVPLPTQDMLHKSLKRLCIPALLLPALPQVLVLLPTRAVSAPNSNHHRHHWTNHNYTGHTVNNCRMNLVMEYLRAACLFLFVQQTIFL